MDISCTGMLYIWVIRSVSIFLPTSELYRALAWCKVLQYVYLLCSTLTCWALALRPAQILMSGSCVCCRFVEMNLLTALLVLWLLWVGLIAIPLDFWIGGRVPKRFHTVKCSVVWGQRDDLRLKSYSYSAPSDFVMVHVILQEPSRCSPVGVDSIGVDSYGFIQSLEDVGHTAHYWVEISVPVLIHLLQVFPSSPQSILNRYLCLSVELEATPPDRSSISGSVARPGHCSMSWECSLHIWVSRYLWAGISAHGIGS